jgi:hypothetical protein
MRKLANDVPAGSATRTLIAGGQTLAGRDICSPELSYCLERFLETGRESGFDC